MAVTGCNDVIVWNGCSGASLVELRDGGVKLLEVVHVKLIKLLQKQETWEYLTLSVAVSEYSLANNVYNAKLAIYS